MNKEQAQQLIIAFNALAPYCPPLLFERAANSPALHMILQVANDQLSMYTKSLSVVKEGEPNNAG